MSLVEIKEEIAKLSHAEFWQFADWFEEFKNVKWDRQIEQDVRDGKLDHLIEQVDEAMDEGKVTPL